jgi:SAM-dependent methyltransferase
MIRQAQRACPLCGHSELRPLHSMRFVLAEQSPLPRAYDIAACARCEFVYADTPGTSRDYERHYAEHSRYEDPSVATGGGDSPGDLQRLDEVSHWIAARVPSAASVLDIGCGNGGLLDALEARGFRQLAGVDPATGCVERLRRKGRRAWRGTVSALPPAAGEFDLVILSHVLEHLLDVRGALGETRTRVAPGGMLYIETPDASRYASRAFVPFYFFDSEHINHFDGASLGGLAGQCGYEVIGRADAELMVEGSLAYPVTRALMALTPAAPVRVAKFTALRQAVEDYVGESNRRVQDGALAGLVGSGRPLALWGAGSYAQRLLARAPLSQAKFVAVVDRDSSKQGLLFAGCRVAAPEAGLRMLPAGGVVIIAAALAAQAIVAECRSMGIECYVPADAG